MSLSTSRDLGPRRATGSRPSARRRRASARTLASLAVGLSLVAAPLLLGGTPTVAAGRASAAAAAPHDAVPQVPERHQVFVRDLPGARAVAEIYPFLEGGRRHVYRSRDLTVRSGACTAYRNGARAASGRWASYEMAGNRTPFFEGRDSPVVFVHKFRGLVGATKAMGQVVRSVRRCEGTHRDGNRRVTSEEVDLPPLADETFAHRVEEGTPLPRDPRATDEFATIWLREGRYVLEARAQHDTRPPDLDRLTRLARLTVDALR